MGRAYIQTLNRRYLNFFSSRGQTAELAQSHQ